MSLLEAERETERLAALAKGLQEECDRLRRSLAEVQAQRDGYLKALYEEMRKNVEHEELDIADLEAASSGPVELLE